MYRSKEKVNGSKIVYSESVDSGFVECSPHCHGLPHQLGLAGTKTSVYDRDARSGTIRASYAVYPPYCIKDPNTGKMSGLFVDVLEEAGRRLGLKVEWTEEVGWGSVFEGLNANRDDIFGAGLWQNASRSKAAAFSNPIIFNPIMVWVRSGDTRFNEKDIESLNSPKVKISVQDGAVEDLISKSDYPLAARVSVPQLSPWTDVPYEHHIQEGRSDLRRACSRGSVSRQESWHANRHRSG